jgi:hypothetical protein
MLKELLTSSAVKRRRSHYNYGLAFICDEAGFFWTSYSSIPGPATIMISNNIYGKRCKAHACLTVLLSLKSVPDCEPFA